MDTYLWNGEGRWVKTECDYQHKRCLIISVKKDEERLKTNCPHILVGTPGRLLALARDKTLNLKHVKHFILDECDKMLEALGIVIVDVMCFLSPTK